MTSRTLTALPLLALFVTGFLTAAAHAQVYKWVDERGVTNYSDGPPADPKAKKSVSTVEDTTSVYTPDKAVTQAIEARQQQRKDPLAEKVTNLERELEAERRARLEAAAAAQARPPASPPAEIVNGYYPYPPAVVIVPSRNRHRNIPQVQIPPGTTAGNVVGSSGFIPGNSAAAARNAPPPRTRRVEPEATRDGSRRNY